MAALHPDLQRSGDADRIHAQMAFIAPVLNSHHRVFHDVRNICILQPLAIARAHREQFFAVHIQHPDHLAIGGRLQILEAGQGRTDHQYRNHQGNRTE